MTAVEGRLDTPQSGRAAEPLRCPRCSASFECGLETGACWCMALPKLEPRSPLTCCLCPDCLQRLTTAAEGAAWAPLAVAEAHVWWADRRHASPRLEELLDEVERERLSAYRAAEDRGRFLVGCTLAKIALGRYFGRPPDLIRFSRSCPDCGRHHGKPRLTAPQKNRIEFSISHSGDLVAVAVAAEAPVGIDLERLDRSLRVDELARLVLAASEARALAALGPERRERDFLVGWTRKEAVAKATGAGLRLPLTQILITPPDEPPQVLAWPCHDPPEGVTLFDLGERDGHLASLAVLGPCSSVLQLDGGELLSTFAAG
jgi:4'-phosphopantetheinyl transferase